MVRAGLSTRGAIERGPRPYAAAVPPASVVAASALAILPIVTQLGWYPDFGFIMLIAWRLLRSDVWPAWWARAARFRQRPADRKPDRPVGRDLDRGDARPRPQRPANDVARLLGRMGAGDRADRGKRAGALAGRMR